MNRLRRLTIFFSLLWFLACGDISYNWPSSDSEPSSDALTLCEAHVDATLDRCEAEPGCIQGISLDPTPVERAMGCATTGLNLASAQWSPEQVFGRQDLLAWISAEQRLDRSFLTVSADVCGEQPIGGDGWCGYQTSVALAGLDLSEPFFLHAVSADEDTLPLRYQLVSPSQWEQWLPRPEAGIECVASALKEGDDLLFSAFQPLGDPYVEPVNLVPPPGIASQEPWLCDGQDVAWREWGYLLRDQNNLPALDSLRLFKANSSGEESAIPFNFALYRCDADGRVTSDAIPESHGCSVTTGDLDVDLVDSVAYVLLLEVPPSAGPSVRIKIETSTN